MFNNNLTSIHFFFFFGRRKNDDLSLLGSFQCYKLQGLCTGHVWQREETPIRKIICRRNYVLKKKSKNKL